MKSLLAIALLTVLVEPVLAQRAQIPNVQIPDNVERRSDVVYCRGGARDLTLDLFLPKTRAPRVPGVIFIHGGGWRGGTRGQFHRQAAHVASTLGYVGATIEYRLSGEAKFPAAVEDAKCAVRWLRANASTFGVDPNRIAAAGGSAGGHLAAMLGVTDQAAGLEGHGGYADFSSRVNAVVAFNGVFDLTRARQTPAGSEAAGGFLGGSSAEQPDLYKKASPVAHVDRASAPFLLLHGTADTTVSIEQSRMMLKQLTDAGVKAEIDETEGAAHGFFNNPPHYQPTLERMVAFLRKQFER